MDLARARESIGALDGIWTKATSGPDAAYEDGRARLSVGLNYVTDSAGTLSANLFADGLAQDGYKARRLSIAITSGSDGAPGLARPSPEEAQGPKVVEGP